MDRHEEELKNATEHHLKQLNDKQEKLHKLYKNEVKNITDLEKHEEELKNATEQNLKELNDKEKKLHKLHNTDMKNITKEENKLKKSLKSLKRYHNPKHSKDLVLYFQSLLPDTRGEIRDSVSGVIGKADGSYHATVGNA